MNNNFYIDRSVGVSVSWENLIRDLILESKYNPFCFKQSNYDIFKHIVQSLLLQERIILLDKDYSKEEITKLLGKVNISEHEVDLEINRELLSRSALEIVKDIRNTSNKWSIELFTSGTTGVPKKIVHSFDSITRSIKISENNQNDIWGFAYNPTHMAGIQVFFQALLNGNSIINLFGLSRGKILETIDNESITHLSATPTFYRLLLPLNKENHTIKRITSGGEKFDDGLFVILQKAFPQAQITNIYASTEAGSIIASKGKIFSIKPGMEHLVRIKNNELLLHHSLIGYSESVLGDWYHTGDHVKLIQSANPVQFEFSHRNNEMINVGGNKVNPVEVEDYIKQLQGVSAVRVYSENNKILGKVIFCEVVKRNLKIDETTIRHYLQTKLQEYKIPRVIKFVKELQTTRTGKVKRN